MLLIEMICIAMSGWVWGCVCVHGLVCCCRNEHQYLAYNFSGDIYNEYDVVYGQVRHSQACARQPCPFCPTPSSPAPSSPALFILFLPALHNLTMSSSSTPSDYALQPCPFLPCLAALPHLLIPSVMTHLLRLLVTLAVLKPNNVASFESGRSAMRPDN